MVFELAVFVAFVPFAVYVILKLRASDTLTRAVRDELLGAIKALRGDLAVARFLAPPTSGDAAPAGGSPPSPPPAPVAPVARKAVTRDDDVHARETVVAPPPAADLGPVVARTAERKQEAEQRAVLAPSTKAKLAAQRARLAPEPAPAPADRESMEEELTQVLPAGKRPTMTMRPGETPVPFPDLTGSQDETPARGTPTQPSPGPAPGKPSR